MTPKFSVITERATGSEVRELCEGIEELCDGKTRAHAIIALLIMVILYQNPDLNEDEIQICVKEASAYISMLVTTIGEDATSIN